MQRFAFLPCVLLLACAHESASKQGPSTDQPLTPHDSAPRASPFELLRVDDSVDAFATISDDDFPPGAGLAKFQEPVPLGPGRFALTHFVRIVSRSGEPWQAATDRFFPWSRRAVHLPAGARFGFEEMFEANQKNAVTSIGYRTFVLTGSPIIDQHEVAEAFVSEGDEDVPEISISMKLTEHGARELQLATAAWIDRRLAILSEGKVQSAPIVRNEINGGHLQIALGPRSGAIVAEANRLVKEILQK